MSLFLRIYRHILPRALPWRLVPVPQTEFRITANDGDLFTSGDPSVTSGSSVYLKPINDNRIVPDRFLTRLFNALTNFPSDVRDFFDGIWEDIFPDTTTQIAKWENQFNIISSGTEQVRRDRIAAIWKAQGGQGLDYLQDIIQDAGFTDVFIHQWWTDTGGGSFTTKDPFDYIDALNNPLPGGGLLLVNKGPTVASPTYGVYLLAPDSDCGSIESECAHLEGFVFIPVEYVLPTDPDDWPFFIYVGGQTFPNHATLSLDDQTEFERLLLTYFPDQQWIGLLIDYV